jgi:hypothetical protein
VFLFFLKFWRGFPESIWIIYQCANLDENFHIDIIIYILYIILKKKKKIKNRVSQLT